MSPELAPAVAVPEIHWGLSSSRVLTMEFMDGVRVTDAGAVEGLGLRPADVAKLVSTAFGEMIFIHGFVHCDPHAANMLIRAHPSSTGKQRQPQLVLLDHGLYRSIPPSLRLNYAGLWKAGCISTLQSLAAHALALVFADAEGVRKHSIALGAGEDLYRLFAAVLTMRSWDNITQPSLDHLTVPSSDEERLQLQGYASQFLTEISALLARLPRVLLLLMKTNDCLRAVDNALGAPVNTFVITARECSKALAQAKRSEGLWARAAAATDLLRLELRMLRLQAFAWLAVTGRGLGAILHRWQAHFLAAIATLHGGSRAALDTTS
eukprot:SM000022S07273  [mRNA]  locus=s22:906467:908354:+ [translate_table: standard]